MDSCQLDLAEGHSGISLLMGTAANDALCKGKVVAISLEWLKAPPGGQGCLQIPRAPERGDEQRTLLEILL